MFQSERTTMNSNDVTAKSKDDARMLHACCTDPARILHAYCTHAACILHASDRLIARPAPSPGLLLALPGSFLSLPGAYQCPRSSWLQLLISSCLLLAVSSCLLLKVCSSSSCRTLITRKRTDANGTVSFGSSVGMVEVTVLGLVSPKAGSKAKVQSATATVEVVGQQQRDLWMQILMAAP